MQKLGVSRSLSNPQRQYRFITTEPSTTSSFHCTEDGASKDNLSKISEENTLEEAKIAFQKGNVETIRRRYENGEGNAPMPPAGTRANAGHIGGTYSSPNFSASSTTYLTANEMPNSSTNRILLDKSHSQLMSSAMSVNELPKDMPRVELSKSSESSVDNENRKPREKPPLGVNNTGNQTLADALQVKLEHTKRELHETIEKNVAWQKYNVEREDFVRTMLLEKNAIMKENSELRQQIEIIKSTPTTLAHEQRSRMDKVIVRLTEDLEKMRQRERKSSGLNEDLNKALEKSKLAERQFKHEIKQLKMELDMEKSTRELKQDNTKALQEKVKILADNNKILGKQVEQLTEAFSNIDSARRASILHTPNSTPSSRVTGPPDASWAHSSPIPSPSHRTPHDSPRNSGSATKFIPLHLKYPLPPTSAPNSSESKKSQRRRTTGSDGSRRTTPGSTPGKRGEEQFRCNFCDKPFPDYRKLLRHFDSCESV